MPLAAATTLVAALRLLSWCNSSDDCPASYRDLATELDDSSAGTENTFSFMDVVACANTAADQERRFLGLQPQQSFFTHSPTCYTSYVRIQTHVELC